MAASRRACGSVGTTPAFATSSLAACNRFRLASALSSAARHSGPEGRHLSMPETSGCGLGLGGLDISLGIVLSGSSQFDPLGDHLTVPVRHVSRATSSLDCSRKDQA